MISHETQHSPLRENILGGLHQSDPENELERINITAGTTDYQWTIHANIIWQPIRSARFGLEYIHLRGKLWNSADIRVHRIQLGMRYDF